MEDGELTRTFDVPAEVRKIVGRPRVCGEPMMTLVHLQKERSVVSAVADRKAQDAGGKPLPSCEVGDVDAE